MSYAVRRGILRIAICDDMEKDRNLLSKLIKETSHSVDIELDISLFSCGEDLEYFYSDGNTHFDIIFIDIYMTGMNGIKTAHKIRKYDSLCKIIFTTASTEHALDGYSVFAYNYLVKPLSIKNFKPVFLKALDDLEVKEQKSLGIKTGSRIQSILFRDIKYIESHRKKIFVYTLQNDIIDGYYKLDDIEALMDDPRFIRTHKSFLVNMDYIKSVEKYKFILRDNTLVPIRQKGFPKIKKSYFEFIIEKTN
jgi:DNA-binding LytR/AlgR family response regulator